MIESTTAKKKDLNFIIIGILFLFSILLFINLSHLDRSSHKLQLLFFVPFGFYLLGIYFLKSVKTGKRNFISLITLIALIIQLALLLTDISLSDDIYRFILEGWAINQGLNPYHTPIGELSAFLSNPEILEKANHIKVTSPYPPLTLLIFAIYLLSLILSVFSD